MTDDVFGTAALRGQVLAAWAADPGRFREDANSEEDLALGGYRDRLVIELAQNAADAAAREGHPGRVRFTLRDGVLAVSNTGAALDAAGVRSLSTLRASAKRDSPAGTATVGRFGVGFSAVLAVSDEPSVLARHGAVRWSSLDARAAVERVPALADELVRRDGQVPVLRLPFPAEGTAPDGYDTVVVLPLRDARAEALVRRLLAEVDDALLLALDAVAELVVEVDTTVRTLRASWSRVPGEQPRDGLELYDVTVADSRRATDSTADPDTRWRVVRTGGRLEPQLLADRPTEERSRPVWSLSWAVPVEDGTVRPLPRSTPRVVHAPTPTDEPLELPALLLASFGLDPTRRQVAPGPLRDFLVERAAEAYPALLLHLPADPGLLALVPSPVPAGPLDAELRAALLDRLPEVPFLAPANSAVGEARLRPRDALVVEGAGPELTEVLATVESGLVAAGWSRGHAALSALAGAGARRLGLPEVVDLLADLDRPPRWWHGLYTALAGTDREALSGLPVPLADGRLVRRPRGLLVADDADLDLETLAPLGLRVVHPDAAHPLLERLGAVPASPRAILADPAVRAAVADSYEAEDPAAVAEAVLGLVRAAGLAPGEAEWLADLALVDADGEDAVAGDLMLPAGPLARVVAEDALGQVAPELVERWGERTLAAVGVAHTFALVRDADVLLDPDLLDHDLDSEAAWAEELLRALPAGDLPPVLGEFTAVRDLDLVAEESWPTALELLSQPPLRAAVCAPVRVLLPDGHSRDLPGYTAWWLRDQPVLAGRYPGDLRLELDPLLAGVYEPAPDQLDAEFLRALGVRTTLAALLTEAGGPDELLARLADPERRIDRAQLRALYTALAALEPDRVAPPELLRAVRDGTQTVLPAEEVVVVDAPDLLPLLSDRALVVVGAEAAGPLADLLDVELASERLAAEVVSAGEAVPVAPQIRELLPGCPAEYREHDQLLVTGGQELTWRYTDGVLHAASMDGLARGLAWAAGSWRRRFEIAGLLAEPERAAEWGAERDFD